MSILSTIATGPWSRFGDRHGRKFILLSTLSGALAMETMFILITTSNTFFSQHAENFAVLGAILDGCVGGQSVFNGVVHAYVSDCTEHGSRSKIFSTLQGVVFCGLALGPWIGSAIVSLFDGTVYLYFYLSVGFYVILLIFVLCLLPESLKQKKPIRFSLRPARGATMFSMDLQQYQSSFVGSFITPITIFFPRKSRNGTRDYNVTFLGAGLFAYIVSITVYQIKYLYAKHMYSWTAQRLGYYMSLLWITKAINLLICLPFIISYFKPKKTESSDFIYSEMRFDNILARCSLFVDGAADALIAVIPSSLEFGFVSLSVVSSFTSGGNPAMHSLGAVCLHAAGRSSEVGSLFGAMAFLNAVSHAFAPSLYAAVYGATVKTFPKAIFVMTSSLLILAVTLLSAIKPKPPDYYSPLAEQDA